MYAKPEGVVKYYHTEEWRKVRAIVMAMHNGIDLWALETKHEFITADTVHHIIPLKEDYGRRRDISNLIPVSDASHKEIEKLYRDGQKEKVQGVLFDILTKHRRGGGGM